MEETDKGLQISWIDNSPEALKRQDAIGKRERMEKGDEEREQQLIQEQIERAQEQARENQDIDGEVKELQRVDGEKIKLNFGSKPGVAKPPTPPLSSSADGSISAVDQTKTDFPQAAQTPSADDDAQKSATTMIPAGKMSLSSGVSKPKNVFAAKKNPLAAKKTSFIEQPKKMSEAERIMKEEIERKRPRDAVNGVGFGFKKQRVG